MTKDKLIDVLTSIDVIYESEDYNKDKETFEPIIRTKPELGIKCLYAWMSKYYVTNKSKQRMEVYARDPSWTTFQNAAYFLMLDRVIAAVALEGQVNSQISDCIKYTLKPGFNIDQETYNWVEFYVHTKNDNKSVA